MPTSRPQRTCIGCGAHTHRSALVRIVRSPDGPVRLDRAAALLGRGAWVHPDAGCIQKVRIRCSLARSFRAGNVTDGVWDDVEELINHQ